jgi:hypothetical protein
MISDLIEFFYKVDNLLSGSNLLHFNYRNFAEQAS